MAIETATMKANTIKTNIMIRGIAILIEPKNIKKARKTVKIREIYTMLLI